MDALSEVLSSLHLGSSFFCRSELTAPWGMRLPRGDCAMFHAIRGGVCWVRGGEDVPATRLEAGDMVIFPHGDPHELVDDPSSRVTSIEELLRCRVEDEGGPLVHGGGGAAVMLLCGRFYFERPDVHPLLSVLPPMIRIPGEGGRAAGWLEETLAIIARESGSTRIGAEAVINRATDVLVIQAIRAYLEGLGADEAAGWLRGFHDGRISRALAMIHRQPEGRWTLEALAAGSGMSRSAFCERFTELVGESPHHYLTRWRIHSAIKHLRSETLTLPEVAERVGYQTETAFSRIFKRHMGVAPGAFRRQLQAG